MQLEIFEMPASELKYADTTFTEDALEWVEVMKVPLKADGMFTALSGKKVVDIVRLDINLSSKYPYKPFENLNDLVKRVAGERADDMLYILKKWS